jgi:galactonate dehydratase
VKIAQVEPIVVHVNHRGDWVFVQVHTDDGLVGLGEASHGGNDALVVSTLHAYHERLRGRDPRQINAIWRQLNSPNAGRAERTALSGLEQALWDILGQSLGAPIHALLGGAVRDRLRLYANINRHVVDRTPDGFAEAASRAVAEGFSAVKLAPFDELRWPDHIRTGPKAAWRPGVERVRAVRAAIGDECELMVDCHGRMDQSEAITVAHALATCNLMWYEEPVSDQQLAELAQVGARTSIPIASAESVFGIEGFAPFVTDRIVDIIMPDVKHDGGIAETQHIAAAARMRQILVAPHNPAGPVATAVSAHVVSTLPNFLILEYAWGEAPWRSALLDPPERIENGYLVLPQGPGLGCRLDARCVEAHRVRAASSDDSSKVVPAS